MKQATKRQGVRTRERIYNFLVKFITKNGFAPSVREICGGVNLRSTASVYSHLVKLEEEGKIEMKEKSTRAIKVIGYEFVRMEETANGKRKSSNRNNERTS